MRGLLYLLAAAGLGGWGCSVSSTAPGSRSLSDQLAGVFIVDSAAGPAAELQLNTRYEFNANTFKIARGGLSREFNWRMQGDTLLAELQGHTALRYRVQPIGSGQFRFAAIGTNRVFWLKPVSPE